MRLFFVFALLILAGCGNLNKLNDNMERSNTMIEGNTAAVQHSSEVIRENTLAVMQSTETLAESKEVIAGSSALLQQAMNQLNLHPLLFPALLLFILLALSLPSLILYCSYKTLADKITALLESGKKKNSKVD